MGKEQSNAEQGEQLVLVMYFCGTAGEAAWKARKSSDTVARTE